MTFEMITGARPFEHESKVTLLGMHVTAPIPQMRERAPDANVPPEVEAIVTRLLAKEATARFADAKELIDALDDGRRCSSRRAGASPSRCAASRGGGRVPSSSASAVGPATPRSALADEPRAARGRRAAGGSRRSWARRSAQALHVGAAVDDAEAAAIAAAALGALVARCSWSSWCVRRTAARGDRATSAAGGVDARRRRRARPDPQTDDGRRAPRRPRSTRATSRPPSTS